MRRLHVDAPGGAYPIFIGAGTIERLAAYIRRHVAPSSVNVVTDRTVDARHGARVVEALDATRVPVRKVVVPPGEKSKSTRELDRIWRALIRDGIDRRALVVALGGGVVGDLAGFAAASVLRGVALVQVPTTLLAMVDSSVGGKTGINVPEGKNLVGAFHQPRAVFIDLDFLRTLPAREMRAGWAEVIKTAAIGDARLFRELEVHARALRDGGGDRLERVIQATCRVKARVVSEDERESGRRMILNFGHTLAHGIESAVGYQGLLHGEAVAIGAAFAGRLGHALGYTDPSAAERIEALLRTYGLPVKLPGKYRVRPARVVEAMQRDKKIGPRGPRWVFVPRIGAADVHDDVAWDGARAAVLEFLGNGVRSGSTS